MDNGPMTCKREVAQEIKQVGSTCHCCIINTWIMEAGCMLGSRKRIPVEDNR
jgi:hypothetical protein